jgi:hypothetical protein
MKKFYLVLGMAIAFFMGCEKRGTPQSVDETPPSISDSSPEGNPAASGPVVPWTVPYSASDINPVAPGTIPVAEEDEKTLQEIIEDYVPTPDRMSAKRVLLFQIEGNFTGSGNREIIGFYQRQDYGERLSIHYVFCFVCDASGEKIESVYPIEYVTTVESETNGQETGLSEALGRYIIWRDRKIGCAGDFNGNGKEELSLYERLGMGEGPIFFEFDGTKFVCIFEIISTRIAITDIDPEKKAITIEAYIVPPDAMTGNRERQIYAWNNDAGRYEKIYSEPIAKPRSVWNWETMSYDEIPTEPKEEP